MRGMSCVGVVVAVLALGVSSAVASSGPLTPPGCTFSNGTTVCETQTVTTSTFTAPAPEYGEGCTQTYESTLTVTTFTAHKGAPNSQGEAVTAPLPFATETVTPVGPPNCPGS